MGEAKHTPGPWDWEYEDAACTRPIALSAKAGDVLTASEDEKGPRAYISEANACLIAAAPDLLAACEATMRFLDANAIGEPPCDPVASAFRRDLADAIWKAKEGR